MSSASSPSTRSAMPLITVSRLLKSCATPPARRPTISIFCACCSCSSSCRCSVMSAAVPTRRYTLAGVVVDVEGAIADPAHRAVGPDDAIDLVVVAAPRPRVGGLLDALAIVGVHGSIHSRGDCRRGSRTSGRRSSRRPGSRRAACPGRRSSRRPAGWSRRAGGSGPRRRDAAPRRAGARPRARGRRRRTRCRSASSSSRRCSSTSKKPASAA